MESTHNIFPPAAPKLEPQIGDTSPIYRNCSQCGESKFYQYFPLKGGNSLYKRRGYCMDCAGKAITPAVHYIFDVNLLDDSKYGFIRFVGPNKKWCNEITLNEAIRFVSLGKARIRTPHHIVQLQDPEPFVKFVLERDSHTCIVCGKLGTEAIRLPDSDEVRCFCTDCADHVRHDKFLYHPPPSGELHVFCDGSVSDDQYGCGVVIVTKIGGETQYEQFRCTRRRHSIYVELRAVSFALRSALDFLDRGGRKITGINIFTDVRAIEDFLGKRKMRMKDVYVAKEVQEIKLLLGNFKKAYPEVMVNIRYIGSTHSRLHRLAHRLSRCYRGTVPTIKFFPVPTPPKRKVYPQGFKLQVVTEARRAGECKAIAKKFGIAVSTLYRWRRQF
jgi:ribonuclease HI